MARIPFFGRRKDEPAKAVAVFASNEDLSHSVSHRTPFQIMAGLSDIVKETNTLRDDTNFDNDFYLERLEAIQAESIFLKKVCLSAWQALLDML